MLVTSVTPIYKGRTEKTAKPILVIYLWFVLKAGFYSTPGKVSPKASAGAYISGICFEFSWYDCLPNTGKNPAH